MQFDIPFNLPGPRPVIAGTGLIALDVVIPNGPHSLPKLWAGGTCGNVLTALSFLGWDAYPIARLRDDASSSQITKDFSRWGVKPNFLGIAPDGSTPVIVQHIHCSPGREATHTFSRRCPSCGMRLPWYKPVTVSNAAEILSKLPALAVFFFDRTSPGSIYLARQARSMGALVVFEPSAAADPKQLRHAMQSAHIVKYSEDRSANLESLGEEFGVPLLIETRGGEGLRYFSRMKAGRQSWVVSKAVPAGDVVDTAGCGDWCTAGLIAALGRRGKDAFLQATPGQLREALRFGQALAAWNCGFEGARGGMYHSDILSFQESIMRLLAGDNRYAPPIAPASQRNRLAVAYSCITCGDKSPLHR